MRTCFSLILLCFGISACTPASRVAPNASDHVTQSEELRSLMQRLSISIYERELTQKQVVKRRRALVSQVSADTTALAAALGHRPQSSGFQPYIKQLRQDAIRLQAAAKDGSHRSLEQVLSSIEATCNACHKEFQR